MQFITTNWSALSDDLLQNIYDLIIFQWEVWNNKVIENLKQSQKIVYIKDKNNYIIGCGCLKNRENNYLKTFKQKTWYNLVKNKYKYELGYLYIKPEYQNQGLWKKLINLLINWEKYLYAVTRKNNFKINSLLWNYWFKIVWKPYYINQKELILLVK